MYTLDTNAIIYYLKGDVNAIPLLEDLFEKNMPIYISSITEVELFSFSNLTNKDIEQITNLIKTLSVISLDSQLARLAGLLRRQYKIKVPDSIIASTAIFTGTSLVTRNTKDFKKIPNFNIVSI